MGSEKNKNNQTCRETMLKINIFQNLTQYLVYFKGYIKIVKSKKANLFYSKYWLKDRELILPMLFIF